MTEWISVDNCLPKNSEPVLVSDFFNKFVSLGRLIDDEDKYCFELMYIQGVEGDTSVTHWMPLPEPPNG